MEPLVLGLAEVDEAHQSLVGGKALNLGRLAKHPELRVPEGFCITTEGYKTALAQNKTLPSLVLELASVKPQDRDRVAEVCGKIRDAICKPEIPTEVVKAVHHHLSLIGTRHAYAVRSSATAEDLPHASFAGQQDTYLNVIGKDEILHHIRMCWASLFTDRAAIYRMQNGFDHGRVDISVVVQRMVFPQASGIMFTADPVSGHRRVVSIDASFGLGEALVSGLVSPDCYKVRDDQIVDTMIASKKIAIYAKKAGGTETRNLEPAQQKAQTLTNAQILELARVGRNIESHFGQPQDIEWCLAEDSIHIVQSRPITTLYPVPETEDQEKHVYISVGHQQMMTDPIKPLGISIWKLTAIRPMFKVAGGRLFADATPLLANPDIRDSFLKGFAQSEPLTGDALKTAVDRGDLIPPVPDQKQPVPKAIMFAEAQPPLTNDPKIAADLIEASEASTQKAKQEIQAKSGTEVFDYIVEDIERLKKNLISGLHLIKGTMDASSWINEKILEWLGEKNVADILSRSVPNNITSEMGLALMDVADAVRPYPEVIAFLQDVKDDNFLDQMANLKGGPEARAAIQAYLDKYGMRCSGEIDITQTRWSEKPTTLVPMILSNVKNFEPGAGKRKFEQGRAEALQKEREILERIKTLPDGEEKARETKERIDNIRNFCGYREYPKYAMVNHYFIYKQALMKEARSLVSAKVIQEEQDIYYLSFEELKETVRTQKVDLEIIRKRKEDYEFYEKLSPPRVITSDGEIITGSYKRDDIPANALVGLPVSSGVIEGRARVLLSMENAYLEEGDILVTAFTDPSWTPLFVSIKGLVTEVGGLMTHGAVIAREYGLPAVVGVERATQLIKDGQRIRVHGTEGFVELL